MKLNLFIVSLLVATMPVCAQAQAPQPIQSPQAPKATQAPKAPKAAKGSKEETTKVAAAQKVVKTISADKAKTQTYCDIDKLATKLGPDYVALIGGLDDIDPDSKEAHDIGSTLASLDKLCAK